MKKKILIITAAICIAAAVSPAALSSRAAVSPAALSNRAAVITGTAKTALIIEF